MIWGDVDAEHQIARADGIAHNIHPLPSGED
jgi:hypothetical protein